MPQINTEFAALLAAAGYPAAAEPEFDWRRVLVVGNVAPVPPGDDHPEYSGWNRGFGLALVGTDGEFSHYVKFRPPGSGTSGRESRILAELNEDPTVQSLLPTIRESSSARAHIQLLPFLPGENFETLGDHLAPEPWRHAIEGILATVDRIAEVANVRCADIRRPEETVSIADETAPTLDYLRTIGLSREHDATLREATTLAGKVIPQFQHGDLWPANIIRSADGWRILDFEHYGVLQLPMFDALHVTRSAIGLRPQALAGEWVNAIAGQTGRWTTASISIIRAAAERRALGDRQIVGLLTFYLATMTNVLHRRGNPQFVWERMLFETRALATLLGTAAGRAALPWTVD